MKTPMHDLVVTGWGPTDRQVAIRMKGLWLVTKWVSSGRSGQWSAIKQRSRIVAAGPFTNGLLPIKAKFAEIPASVLH